MTCYYWSSAQIIARYCLEQYLTHWGRVTHICLSELTSIGSDDGLSPGRRQAIIRTNAGILLIRPLGTKFSEILIEILLFSFKKMRLKMSFAKRRPFCLGLNVLNDDIAGLLSNGQPTFDVIPVHHKICQHSSKNISNDIINTILIVACTIDVYNASIFVGENQFSMQIMKSQRQFHVRWVHHFTTFKDIYNSFVVLSFVFIIPVLCGIV